ncbi:uncharacterized protein [Amphiura filiformis]|uniref:uncharacterized protein n=1 Tax=Amphiura filiformis TaxID=82378 RepID=UPI003B211057
MDKRVSDADISYVARKTKLTKDHLSNLYIELDIGEDEIENAKGKADTKDFKLQAISVLKAWRSSNGRNATRKAILEALKECDLIDAKEHLEEEWSVSLEGKRRRLSTPAEDNRTDQRIITKNEEDPNLPNKHAINLVPVVTDEVNLPSSNVLTEKSLQNLFSSSNDKQVLSYDETNSPKKPGCSAVRGGHQAITNPILSVKDDRGIDEIVHRWCEDLKDSYLRRRGKIQFGSHFRSVVDSDHLHVNLELLQDGEIEVNQRKKLNSHLDLLAITNDKGKPCTHVLLRGYAGCGKSTLINTLAHGWALNLRTAENHFLNKFCLVLALDVRRFERGDTLQQAIKNQILPVVSIEEITKTVHDVNKKCLFLIDGYDEISPECQEDQTKLLDSPLLDKCWVIMTTRPHSIDEFRQTCQSFDQFVHVEVSGFTKHSVNEYISKFFQVQQSESFRKHSDLLQKRMRNDPTLRSLSTYPILLLMICHLWRDKQDQPHLPENLPESITQLYTEAVEYLNKHWHKRYKPDKNKVMHELGRIAIKALFDGQLSFEAGEEDEDCLQNACEIGLIYREEMERHKTVNSFIHKTFHEFCAAIYLANLANNDDDEFSTYLCKIDDDDQINRMEYVLWFCCGLSEKAATLILHHVIEIISNRYGKDQYWSNVLKSSIRRMFIHGFPCEEDECSNRGHTKIPTPDDRKWNLPLKLFIEAEAQSNIQTLEKKLSAALEMPLSKSHNVESLDVTKYISKPYPVNLGILLRFLRCLPSLRKISLRGIRVPGHLIADESMVFKNSELDIMYTDIAKPLKCQFNTLYRLLHHMPLLTNLALVGTCIDGKLQTESPKELKSIKTFHVRSKNEKPHIKSVMKLARLMPMLEKLSIMKSKVEQWNAKQLHTCKELKEFKLAANEAYEMSEKHLITLMDCVYSLDKLLLHNAQIKREMKKSIITPRVFLLKELALYRCNVKAGILLRLLGCTPSIQKLTMDDIHISGDMELEVSYEVKNLKELKLATDIEVEGNTLYMFYKLYKCISSLKIISYSVSREHYDYCIKEIVDSIHLLKVHKLRKEIKFNNCNVKVKTLMFAVSHISSLKILKLSNILFIDSDDADGVEENENSLQCKSLEELHIIESTIEMATLYKLLCSMPSIETLYFTNSTMTGNVPLSMLVPCRSLSVIGMNGNRVCSNIIFGLLNAIPNLKEIGFENDEIGGELPTSFGYTGATVLKSLCLSYNAMNEQTLRFFARLFSLISRIDTLVITSTDHANKRIQHPDVGKETLLRLFSSASSINKIELWDESAAEIMKSKPVKCKSLKELALVNVDEGEKAISLQWLQSLPSLQTLTLNNIGITAESFTDSTDDILKLPLNQLELRFNDLSETNVDLKCLCLMPSVQKLIIENGRLLFERTLPTICHSLNEFSLMYTTLNKNTNVIPMKWFRTCHCLEILSLQNVFMKDTTALEKSITFQSLKVFILEYFPNHISAMNYANAFAITAIVLSRTPNLQTLKLTNINMNKSFGLDFALASICLKELRLINVKLSGKNLSMLLKQMPLLSSFMLYLKDSIEGDLDTNVQCKKLKTFEIKTTPKLGPILVKLLAFMPALQNLRTSRLYLIEALHEYDKSKKENLSTTLKTVSVFGDYDTEHVLGDYDTEDEFDNLQHVLKGCDIDEDSYDKKLKLNEILAFAHRCPSVEELDLVLDETETLVNDIYFSKHIEVECKAVTTFKLSRRQNEQNYCQGECVTGQALSYILRCMPSLDSIELFGIDIKGMWKKIKVETFPSVTKFIVQDGTLDGRVLLKLLACMSSLKTLSLEKVGIQWELDTTIRELCDELMECNDIDESMRKRIRNVVSETLNEYIMDKLFDSDDFDFVSDDDDYGDDNEDSDDDEDDDDTDDDSFKIN